MTKEEYRVKQYQMRQKYEAEEFALRRDYALANNTVKIGDVISDHNITLKVESIKTVKGITNDYPECLYKGIALTKDGKPRKDQSVNYIYQSNIGK